MDRKSNERQEHDSRRFRWGPERWARCCPGMGVAESAPSVGEEGQSPMARCFSCCRYFVLFLAIMGIIFLAVGYYVNPEVIRTIWMIGAGVAVVMALFAAVLMRRMARGSGFAGCCGPWSRRSS